MLDDAVWARAVPATDFRQRDPRPGDPATERTEVRVAVDGRRLLLGVVCFDSEPDRMLANQMQRDESFGGDDRFLWGLDTYLDGRTGYFFEINPAGAMGDGLVTGPGGGGGGGNFGGDMNKSWDGIWMARVRRTDRGWTAEIEIPFRTLNLNPNTDAWGVNFQRTVRRKNEESLWTGWERTEGLLRMSNAGRLTGIGKVSTGLGLEVKPYGVASVGNAPGLGLPATTGDAAAGVDLFYNITPGLRANFTVNTDFAETEVDQRRTNLTRFPLFFPERRDFFLEGSTFFDFPPGDAQPFFSRRIGLQDGQPQRVLFGTKLTGQVGQQDVGALHVRTGDDDGEPGSPTRSCQRGLHGPQAQAAVRPSVVCRPALHASRERRRRGRHRPTSTRSATTSRSRRRRSSGRRRTSRPAPTSCTRRASPTRRAGRTPSVARAVYNNEPMSAQDLLPPGRRRLRRRRRVHAAAELPPLEFALRVRAAHQPGHHSRVAVQRLRRDLATLPDNTLITRQFFLTPLEVIFDSGDRLQFQMFQATEQLEVDFEISDGILLPFGSRYAWSRQQVMLDSAQNRPVSTRAEYSFGEFYSGDRRELNLDVRLRPRRGLFVQASSEYNDVTLVEGAFTTKLYRLDVRTQFSPWICALEQHPVRHAEPVARLADALPLDPQARQQPVRRLHAQLARRHGASSPSTARGR